MTDIEIPEDTRKSRLVKPRADVVDDEFVTAADRFAAFRETYPNGYVEATIDRVLEHPDGHVTYVMQAVAYIERPSFGVVSRPDATAWAQGSTRDENPIIAGSPLESADTIARSRAIRNLGILTGAKPAAVSSLGAPQTDEQIGAAVRDARRNSGLNQAELTERMRKLGVPWADKTLTGIETGKRRLLLSEAQRLAQIIGFGS